jgi:hypothetical protein
MLERFLSTDEVVPRELGLAVVATVISTHSAFLLYRPSLISLLLGICQALFLGKGLLAFTPESDYELVEVKRSTFVGYSFPHSNFLVRVRTVALWLAVTLAITSLHSDYRGLTAFWWKRVGLAIALECATWSIICFLVVLSETHSNHSS